jgi:hypothetical protein
VFDLGKIYSSPGRHGVALEIPIPGRPAVGVEKSYI